MSSRELYLNRPKACVSAANAVADPSEQMALMKIAQSYMLLADYIANRQEHGTAHRESDGYSVTKDS
jgi:hypothetical protein